MRARKDDIGRGGNVKKTKALSKWNKRTTLSWGAEVSLQIEKFKEAGNRVVTHTFVISHQGTRHNGLILNVVPKLSSNIKLNATLVDFAPKDTVGGSTTFVVKNPEKGDVFFVEPTQKYETGYLSTLFVYTGYRWKTMPRSREYYEEWGTTDCYIQLNQTGTGPYFLGLFVNKYKGMNLKLCFNEIGDNLMQMDRQLMFDFFVGRKSFAYLIGHILGHAQSIDRCREIEIEKVDKRRRWAEDEVNRLRLAGIFFANRIWKARSVSKSEAFAEPRRQFEAALCMKRIEEGPNKGDLVEISPQEAAEILGVKIEK